jgi:gluconokinase
LIPFPKNSEIDTVLAIDIGSSSIRTALGSAICQVTYTAQTTPDGGVTVDPAMLLRLVADTIDQALQSSQKQAITHVGIDTFVGNLMGVDTAGQPTTPLFTWADSRSIDLHERLDPQAYTERTGARLHPSYAPVRLHWIAQNMPDAFKQTRYWMTFGEYLLLEWCGVRVASPSAAAWNGLLNRQTMTWDRLTLAALPIQPDQLSEISEKPIFRMVSPWADRWPRLREAAWHPAIGDGYAANVGVGCVNSQNTALTLGTSGAIRILTSALPERVPEGLFAYRVNAAQTLVGGAVSSGGNFYAWMHKTFAIDAVALTAAAAEKMAPDSHGLTVLPYVAGERAPGWKSEARALFAGMTLDTTPADLIRAGIESVAYNFATILRRFPEQPQQVIASGGAIGNSPVWAQIIADALGIPVVVSADTEATLRGTGFLAAGLAPHPVEGQTFQPDPAHHAVYQQAIARQEAAYRRWFG